jgi:hypothetical protein
MTALVIFEPDADLLALVKEWRKHLDWLNSRESPDDEGSARDEEYRWRIARTPAHSINGALAKLRVAWEDIGDGQPVSWDKPPEEQYVADQLIHEAMRDLARIAGDGP